LAYIQVHEWRIVIEQLPETMKQYIRIAIAVSGVVHDGNVCSKFRNIRVFEFSQSQLSIELTGSAS
jgi:hypothetical protein